VKRRCAQKARTGRSRIDRPGLLGEDGLSRSRNEPLHPSAPEDPPFFDPGGAPVLLADTIAELHFASRSTYGSRRMRAALFHERGLVVNRKLIQRIMGEQSLAGLSAQKMGRRNLVNVVTSKDLVNRNFTAPSTNALWLILLRGTRPVLQTDCRLRRSIDATRRPP
jgi:hypothetical protein